MYQDPGFIRPAVLLRVIGPPRKSCYRTHCLVPTFYSIFLRFRRRGFRLRCTRIGVCTYICTRVLYYCIVSTILLYYACLWRVVGVRLYKIGRRLRASSKVVLGRSPRRYTGRAHRYMTLAPRRRPDRTRRDSDNARSNVCPPIRAPIGCFPAYFRTHGLRSETFDRGGPIALETIEYQSWIYDPSARRGMFYNDFFCFFCSFFLRVLFFR